MKRSNKTDGRKSARSIGLLPSMLIIFISALLVCVSLTILVFSLVGTSVYAELKAREMLPQLRSITSVSSLYMRGSASISELFLLTRASEATLVILDENCEEYIYHDPKQREMPSDDFGPGGFPGGEGFDGMNEPPADFGDPADIGMENDPFPEKPRDDWDDPNKNAQHKEYVSYCQSIFSEVMNATENNEFTRFNSKVGVVVALPIVSDGQKTGAAYLITPLIDLNEASRSVVFALVFSSAVVAVLMVLPLFLVASWLARPIKKMTKAALSLAEGNYNERVEIAGSTEVRELGESFNTLADNLKEKIGDLVIERNRLRAILDGMNEGIIGTDTKGRVIQHNNAAVKLLGGREGCCIESLPCYKQIGSAVTSALEGGEGYVENLTCGERTLHIRASAIQEETGATVGSVALIMDITEAERLEQTRRDYVANVSHELRTPLASIRGIADMLNDGLVKNESDKVRYYGYILKESIRLSTLINDLLELSRLQSGGVALEMRRVELYELMRDVADRMSEPAQENEMTVKILVDEGVYYAHSNADRLEQVLISLTDNAVKHGTHGGCISMGIEEAGDKWNIFVENPADVDPNDIEHLFERFYKADTSHTGEGTGLGLAITREVLHLMGEQIWIDYSDGVIRFTFTAEREQAKRPFSSKL